MKDALSFNRVSHDDTGLAGFCSCGSECLANRCQIMAINLLGMPAEGLPFGCQGFKGQHLLAAAGGLPFVVIHDGREVVDVLACRKHSSFLKCCPHCTRHRSRGSNVCRRLGCVGQLLCQGPSGDRDPGSSGCFHAGDVARFGGVLVEDTSRFAKFSQVLN